jgi:hypothetical protein
MHTTWMDRNTVMQVLQKQDGGSKLASRATQHTGSGSKLPLQVGDDDCLHISGWAKYITKLTIRGIRFSSSILENAKMKALPKPYRLWVCTAPTGHQRPLGTYLPRSAPPMLAAHGSTAE